MGILRRFQQYQVLRSPQGVFKTQIPPVDGGNEPFGSRSEPDIRMTRNIHRLPPGEVPMGPAGAHPNGHSAHQRKRI